MSGYMSVWKASAISQVCSTSDADLVEIVIQKNRLSELCLGILARAFQYLAPRDLSTLSSASRFCHRSAALAEIRLIKQIFKADKAYFECIFVDIKQDDREDPPQKLKQAYQQAQTLFEQAAPEIRKN